MSAAPQGGSRKKTKGCTRGGRPFGARLGGIESYLASLALWDSFWIALVLVGLKVVLRTS